MESNELARLIMDAISDKKGEDIVMVSPDAGGVERARAIAKRLDASVAMIDKRRTGPNVAKAMNVVGEALMEGIAAAIDRLAGPDVKGLILTSGKSDFCAGGDLERMFRWTRPEEPFDATMAMKKVLRQLETQGKPVLAAIAGHALGGGFEIMLSTDPRFATTFGASCIAMWMMTLTSMDTLNASAVRSVMVFRFESSLCALDSLSAQFRRICVVGTLSTLQIFVFSGCFPGPRGSAQMPRLPFFTNSGLLYGPPPPGTVAQ